MSYILSRPPSLEPGPPEVPKVTRVRRVYRMSHWAAIIGLGVAFISLLVELLSWRYPIAPVSPPVSRPEPEVRVPSASPGPAEVSPPNSVPPPAVPLPNEETNKTSVAEKKDLLSPRASQPTKQPVEPPDRIVPPVPRAQDISLDPLPVAGSLPGETATTTPVEPFDPSIVEEGPPPSPGEEDPPMTLGEQIDVVAKPYYTPKGARSRTDLRYPLIPSDALRSLLSDKLIVCMVSVEADGTAVADCSQSPSTIPVFLLHRAKESLEKALWEPATNEWGEPCPDEVPVEFQFRGLRKK